MIKPSFIHCAFLFLLFAWPSSSLNAAIINLSCEGTRGEKHYPEKKEITYLAQIDLDRNEILLKTPRIIFKYDTKGESSNPKPDVELTRLKIYARQDGFLFIEKEGKVSDADLVMGLRQNSLHEWPVIGRFFNGRTAYEVKSDLMITRVASSIHIRDALHLKRGFIKPQAPIMNMVGL
jgi:hypothetical protein